MYALLPSVLAAIFCFSMSVNVWISVGVFAAFSTLVVLSYQRYGYYLHEDIGRFYMVVRKGLIGVHYRVFELYKAQSAHTVCTYLMRKSSLKSMYIQLASGSVFVPYIKQHDANFIVDFTIKQVESNTRSWM